MLPYILFIIGLAFLVKGADFLVEGASSIARHFHISDLVIGLTIVALGTSTPELFVNVVASIKGNTGIAVGNVVGSSIANILLIAGISAVICPLSVTKSTAWRDIPFSLLAAILLGIAANDRFIDSSESSVLTRSDGLVFLSFFIIFLYYSFSIAKNVESMTEEHSASPKQSGLFISLLLIITGLTGLTLGGQWIVDSAIFMALKFGMSESLVGLTIVAVGTSLPELATSAVAAYRKNADIAIGNIIGSNIFNIFFVLGISSIIKPLPFHSKDNIGIGVLVFSNLVLFFSMFAGRKYLVDRWEGNVFLILYLIYISFLIIVR